MSICVIFLALVCQALVQVPVYRLIQYDYEGNSYGSQVSSFNFLGAVFDNEKEVPRKIALIHEKFITQESLESTINLKPSAILIILASPSALAKEIQAYLGSNTFHFPIYFAHETQELLEVYESLKETGEQAIDSDQLQFSVASEEKPVLRNLQQENFYGFIDEFSENHPTLALVTYADSFSVVPELTSGAESNGSGLAVLLELVRVLKKMYSSHPASFNVLFLVSGSGTTNHQGLKHWLSAEDQELQQIRGSISYALCLDTLGSSNGLNLHMTRFHKEGENDLLNLYASFNLTSEKTKLPLNYIKKKVNMADPFTPWQHESFVRNKIVSGTVSRLETSRNSMMDHGLIQDSQVDLEAVMRNFKFIGEVLVRHLYALNDTAVFSKNEFSNMTRFEELFEKIKEFNRFPSKLTPASKFSAFLQSTLKELGVNFKQQKFPATEVTLYASKAESLSVYKVKPAMLDFYLFLVILAYLAALWGGMKVFTKQSKVKRS